MSTVPPVVLVGKPLASPPPPTVPEPSETEPDIPPPLPQLALRCDGAILLSVEELGGLDLSKYTVWTAIVLPPEESEFARERFFGAAQETAAKIIGHLRRKPTE